MPMQAQREDGGIAATRWKTDIRGRWVITMFRLLCSRERVAVPIVHEALWASVLVWTDTEKLTRSNSGTSSP